MKLRNIFNSLIGTAIILHSMATDAFAEEIENTETLKDPKKTVENNKAKQPKDTKSPFNGVSVEIGKDNDGKNFILYGASTHNYGSFFTGSIPINNNEKEHKECFM